MHNLIAIAIFLTAWRCCFFAAGLDGGVAVGLLPCVGLGNIVGTASGFKRFLKVFQIYHKSGILP